MINEHDIKDMDDDGIMREHCWYPSYKESRLTKMTPAHMVKEFIEVTSQVPTKALYAGLIKEEFEEWYSANIHSDRAEELKELTDLVYVIFGYAEACGWDLMEAFRRVHVNNVGRCVQSDGSVQRNSSGKIIKNPAYPKVYLGDLVG